MNQTFIFVDGSYYCFYRYCALLQWWKNAKPTEKLDNPYSNATFIEKFTKTFIDNLHQMPKKLKIHKDSKPILIVGKDCKRSDIWRNAIFKQYKANRPRTDDSIPKFFKMVYDKNLFEKGGSQSIIQHSALEADDCIAISVKYLLNKYPYCNIYIITSDHDYLQLHKPNVSIYTLSYQNLSGKKTSTGNGLDDLRVKIIMGDKSDNIPSVFPKCGLKTALKCIHNEEYFKKKMNNNQSYYDQLKLNEELISFDKIPLHYTKEFITTIKDIF